MLKELFIKNMAVIDEVRIPFDKGFHIFTGETGAGKSILVESIGLMLGEKAKSQWIRKGQDQAFVEAVFDIGEHHLVKNFLSQKDFLNPDDEDELLIKRVLQTDGKNKIFVNHQRATLSLLQEMADLLIDFTGQHDQLQLLNQRNDREILDSFVKDLKPLQAYQKEYDAAASLHKQIQQKEKQLLEKDERLQWIDFQLKELANLSVTSEEEIQELAASRALLKNQDLIKGFASKVDQGLVSGATSCLATVQELQSDLERKEGLSDLFPKAGEALDNLKLSLEDLAYEVSRQASQALPQTSYQSLDEIESLLHRVSRLKKKFGPELADVLGRKGELEQEKEDLEALDVDLENLRKKLGKQILVLKERAEGLLAARQTVAKKVSDRVKKELKSLDMVHAQFEVRVEITGDLSQFQNYGRMGADAVSFWLSPNPGLGFQPLAKIASGGETSRLFLAIKNVLSESSHCQTFIFDEIDTGISGAAVEMTGTKLKDLSKKHQVFCITHHAQIAGLADHHYRVSKLTEKNKTITRVQTLVDDDRVEEVARLMGGVELSETNLAYAREILSRKK